MGVFLGLSVGRHWNHSLAEFLCGKNETPTGLVAPNILKWKKISLLFKRVNKGVSGCVSVSGSFEKLLQIINTYIHIHSQPPKYSIISISRRRTAVTRVTRDLPKEPCTYSYRRNLVLYLGFLMVHYCLLWSEGFFIAPDDFLETQCDIKTELLISLQLLANATFPIFIVEVVQLLKLKVT